MSRRSFLDRTNARIASSLSNSMISNRVRHYRSPAIAATAGAIALKAAFNAVTGPIAACAAVPESADTLMSGSENELPAI